MNEIPANDVCKPDTGTVSEEPQFGLLDMVEAFTAMRHEWRTQSKQNRDLAQSIQAITKLLTRVESTIDQKFLASSNDGGLQKLISLVIDLDISLTRAVEATSQHASKTQQAELLASVRRSHEQAGFFSRLVNRRFYHQIILAIQNQSPGDPDPSIEGVRLVLHRLRRMMSDQDLTRVETVGKEFDGETMKAISAIESNQQESGNVVQEITPAYFYKGRLVRVAEVRVAK